MSVKVTFRGVMLFVFKDGVLTEVLIPDCEQKPRYGRRGDSGWEHFDGSVARPHYPGMLIDRDDFAPLRVPLRGSELNIVAYNGGKNDTPTKWKFSKDVRPHPPKLDYARIGPYASRVRFRGAELDTRQLSNLPILFGKDDPVAPVVFGEAERVEIKMPFSTEETVESGQIWIYNWDNMEPEVADLDRVPQDEQVHSLIDADFRWLYSMLQVDPKTVFSAGMPAPWFYAEDGRTVSVSTCFPAYTEDVSRGPNGKKKVTALRRKVR